MEPKENLRKSKKALGNSKKSAGKKIYAMLIYGLIIRRFGIL